MLPSQTLVTSHQCFQTRSRFNNWMLATKMTEVNCFRMMVVQNKPLIMLFTSVCLPPLANAWLRWVHIWDDAFCLEIYPAKGHLKRPILVHLCLQMAFKAALLHKGIMERALVASFSFVQQTVSFAGDVADLWRDCLGQDSFCNA